MTEAEWLDSTDPGEMVEFLRGRKASDRKARLLACGVSRMLLVQGGVAEELADVIELTERLADGARVKRKVKEAWKEAWNVANPGSFDAASGAVGDGALNKQRRNMPGLIRCVFGNPFQEKSVAPNWLTSIVTSLAQAAYDDRALPSGHLDTQRLAILADALEDAGCTETWVLNHLRSAGPHVRGCRALDLLLGTT